MSHITLYLDRETERFVRTAARRSRLSVSRWISSTVRRTAKETWPESVRRLSGAWRDFPTAEQLRADTGTDVPREPT
jgi:hypothetical protein